MWKFFLLFLLIPNLVFAQDYNVPFRPRGGGGGGTTSGALSIDAAGEFARVSWTGHPITDTADFTIEFQFKSLTASHSLRGLISSSSSDSSDAWALYVDGVGGSSDQANWWANPDDFTFTSVTTPQVDTTNWNHWAMVYDSTNDDCLIYINGSLTQTIATCATTWTETTEVTLGRASFAGAAIVNGLISDVRLWSDIRTATEINNNKLDRCTGSEANLVAYWKLDTDANDSTSGAHNLTLQGTAGFTADGTGPTYTGSGC